MSLIAPDASPKPRGSQFLGSHIFVSASTSRSLRTAAELLGLPTGDHAAEVLLATALESVPGLSELNHAIAQAVAEVRAKHQPTP